MKMTVKAMVMMMAAAVVAGLTGCSGMMDDDNDSVKTTYNVDWCSKKVSDDKALLDVARKCNKIVIGKTCDYKNEVAGLTAIHCGETPNDAVYAYYDGSEEDAKLYVLADQKIVFEDDDRRPGSAPYVEYDNGIFDGCKKLTDLRMENIDTSKMTNFAAFFRDCEKLESIDVSLLDTSNAKKQIYGMFMGCMSLTKLDLTSLNTSKIEDIDVFVDACINLKELDMSTCDLSNVKTCFNMFSNCEKLEVIWVKEGTDFSQQINPADSGDMFFKCYALRELNPGALMTAGIVDNGYSVFDSSLAYNGGFFSVRE